jgi:hypothetical protein
MTTWNGDIYTLLEQYVTSDSREKGLIASHIEDIIQSNYESDPELNDPELKKYIITSLENVIQAAQHAMSALCHRPPTKKEN